MTDAAGFPELQSLVAFGSDYTDTTPAWDDVTALQLGFTSRRGRPAFESNSDTGDLTHTLDNTDGDFDPENTTGPYYGLIRPMRRTRVIATVGGTVYPIFTGYTGDWRETWAGQSRATETTASDRFKLLNWLEDTHTRPAEDAADRITAILQHAGIGSTDRSINPGGFASRALHGHPYVDDNVLSALQDAAHSDGGLLFVDALGLVVFQPVTYRQIGGATRARTSQATFGPDAPAIPVENDLSRSVGDSVMANHITVTDHAGGVHIAQDAALMGSDGPLYHDVGSTQLEPTDATDRAGDVLNLMKNPTPRYPNIVVDLLTLTEAEQQTVLGLEISDRITIAVAPWARDQWIESIAHNADIEGRTWSVTFGVSSAGDVATAWP